MELIFTLSRVKPDCKTNMEILKEYDQVCVSLKGNKDLVETVFNILRSEEKLNYE